MAEFVNPYTFLPLPEAIHRDKPAWHHRAVPGNLTGIVSVTWTLATPLLLPEDHPAVTNGEVRIPGSSVKGAVRSLHEALMGGCLRVLDEDFVPIYREPAVSKGDDWRLAIVTAATTDGKPTSMTVTSETAWVPVDVLEGALGRPPASGDRVSLNGTTWRQYGKNPTDGRSEAAGATAGRSWVVLVGDSGTRGKAERFFCAAGKLDSATMHDVDPAAWREFDDLCDGTTDRRLVTKQPPDARYAGWQAGRKSKDVRWQKEADQRPGVEPPIVGRRQLVTGLLWPGDVVWAKVPADGGAILHIAMAAIWRRPGTGPLGRRVPPDLHACTKACWLCNSCRLFGSANTRERDSGARAEQDSYAGHVRFGDAVAKLVTTETIRQLAPMGAPRPGSGQFYLKITSTEPATGEAELPSAWWGSEHDRSDAPRHVRGRKFYWYGDPTARTPSRHEKRRNQPTTMSGEGRLVVPTQQTDQKSTTFRQTISFENVPAAELASLVLALSPHLVPSQPPVNTQYTVRLGGGKPLGLGGCHITVTSLTCVDAIARYSGSAFAEIDPAKFVADHRAGVEALSREEVCAQWPTLLRILRTEAVDPKLIWYPLGGEWSDGKLRDRSFRFFQDSNGQFYEKVARRKNIRALPDPDPAARHNQQLPGR